MPSLHRHYPASIHSIGLRASTVLCILRTPCCHLPPLLARLVGHTRTGMIGLHDASKNFRASLVALTTCCVARMGLRLRVSDHRSPGRGTGVAFRHEHTLGRIRQKQRFRSSIPFRAGELSPYLSSSLPFCVRFNQRLRRNRLIRWLQHSIRGLWLEATPAGFAPARPQTISSPHVHPIVLFEFYNMTIFREPLNPL